ncbi:MAG: hypothetical protein Q9191_007046 [Dirinaria sp. TL-2023a]
MAHDLPCEGRPSCMQCVKSRRICPGYAQPLDLVLRDQTRMTQDKVEARKLLRNRTDLSTESSHPSTKPIRAIQSQICAREVVPSPLWLPNLSPSSREDVAVCMFFSHIVSVPRHPETVRNFLECVLPLYRVTAHGSLLHQAVSCVSLAVVGGSPLNLEECILSRRIFGKALKATRRAINDPQESVNDETLMAVLLLSLYERIMAVSENASMSCSHDAGAVALVKHRGKRLNTKSKVAAMLFNAVHSQIVSLRGPLDGTLPIEGANFPKVEHALDEPVAIGNDLADCLALVDGVPQTAGSRLNLVCTGLIDLRRDAESILGNNRLQAQIPRLLADAIEVNQQLFEWADSVPPELHKAAAKSFETPQHIPREQFMYEGTIDVYLDLPTLQIWNLYRVTKIRVLTIILKCLDALCIPGHGIAASKRQEVSKDLQDLVDDICASIPFHLGTKMVPGTYDDPGVEYPYIHTKIGPDHRRAAAAVGGFILVEPYTGPLKVAIEAPCTREGQRGWLLMQLSRLADLYNIPETVALIKENIRPVSTTSPPGAATPKTVNTGHVIVDSREY